MSRASEPVLSAAKLALTIKRMRSEQPGLGLLQSEPIALVGIGCRLPGGIESADDYWRLLHGGLDAIGEVPANRWDADRYYDVDPHAEGKMNTRSGGFLEGVDRFDPTFFGISPREAAAMDPQQRLLLEVTWQALWDAGMAPDSLAGTSTGVFFGVYGTDYARLLMDNPRAINSHSCAGAAHSMASGRVSFLLDLRGPSISIDTACSSSLVALHLACQHLRTGSCRMAIAGGVSLKLQPEHYLCLSKLGMLSPDGRCKTFDAAGNGFVPGEGCGVVLLMPLSDALAMGCRVYSVIRGVAANQDGRTNSLTAPNGLAQQSVIRQAIENARISPGDISYVETHGTGTALGDPIEVEALAETVGNSAFGQKPCALGAAKTNIGHLEGASGIAGMIKAVLALYHEEIPPNLHYRELNPNIVLEGTRFFVPVTPTPWPRSNVGRFAAVSSFGFSGTNAHVVLEEAPRIPVDRNRVGALTADAIVLAISARSPEGCEEFVRRYRDFLHTGSPDTPLYDMCHSAAVRRSHYEERLTVTASSRAGMCELLDDYLAGRQRFGVSRGRANRDSERVIFVFSGQGSQWPRMGLGLYRRFPVFRAALDECEQQIRRYAGWSLIDVLSADEPQSKLAHTEYAQPALFAIEVALARLWQSWGVLPLAVVGHSAGEVAAAHVAGALSLETAVRIVVLRGRLMEAASGLGKMAVIHQPWVDLTKELLPFGKTLSIGAVNSPRSTVISGDTASVDALLAKCSERGIASRPVPVDYAFHSPQMEPFSEALLRELGSVERGSMLVQMISTVTGRRVTATDLDATYWARNIRQPVLFANAIQSARKMSARTFLEVGPHGVLLNSIAECFETEADPALLVASMRRNGDDMAAVLSAAGSLYTQGCPIVWNQLYTDHAAPVALPAYPFQRQKTWVDAKLKRTAPEHEILPLTMRQVRSPGLTGQAFETHFGTGMLPYLVDHKISGEVLLPMTSFLELARRAVQAAGRNAQSLKDFAILQPLVLTDSEARTVQVVIEGDNFKIYSLDGDDWRLHATGSIAADADALEGRFEERHYVDSMPHYTAMADSGATFGPAFQTIRAISAGKGEAWARVVLLPSEAAETGSYLLHPALLDGCLQTVLSALPAHEASSVYIPFGISSFTASVAICREVTAHVRLQPRTAADSIVADVNVWNGRELVARITGLRMNRVTGDIRRDRRIYEVQWRETKPGPALKPSGGDWLIVSNDVTAAGQLSREMKQTGCGAFVYRLGVPLNRASKPRGIVFLCESDAANLSAEAPVQTCTDALAALSQIVKEFPSDPPQLCVVTRGATAPLHGDSLPQSALLGFMRSVAMEHPDLQSVRIDIDSSTAFDRIAAEIAGWDGETELAFREGRRYVSRLRHLTSSTAEPRRWKSRGVGSIDDLSAERMDRRPPAADEVEIEVAASALNFRDVLSVLGMYPGGPVPLGLEFCGRVACAGAGTTAHRSGDRVAGIAWGSLSSFVTTRASLVFPVPDDLSNAEAATLPNAFLTAYHCLIHLGRIQRGQRVLIHLATGGVGLAAVQLARLAGAEIFATAGSDEKREYLRSLGISQVFSSRSLDFSREISAATGGKGVDLVLNSLSGDFIQASLSVLASGGCFIEIGKNAIWSEDQVKAKRRDCRYLVTDLAAVIESQPDLVRQHFAEIRRLLDRHEITALPFHLYDFDDVPLAFRLMSQARHIGKIVLQHSPSLMVAGDRTFLITGGLGAIGLQAAKWLAGRGARHLVLLGRRAPSATASHVIDELEQRGVQIAVQSVDISNREDLASVLNYIAVAMPPLGGIIHSAGVLDDGILVQQTPERLQRVMAPKIAGALHLHELTMGLPLDFFILCSSIASVTGSPAQAGYSAANAWLDAFAHYRRRLGLPALSVNWGAWLEGGMASETKTTGKRSSLPGVKTMAAADYWKCLEQGALHGRCQVTIAEADWSQWKPMPSLLTALVKVVTPEAASVRSPGIRERLAATPNQNRRAVMLEYLRNQAIQLLGLGSQHVIDEREPLIRMGLDSLMAVEFRNQLSAALDRPLMATLMFDHPTLASLADFLLGLDKPAVAERDQLFQDVQALSDQQAEELLRQELERL